ncbi:hypothetical protein SH668x_002715 [Planctomicrobium sp. SH668]|uniref:hypothetical protein n=1 Tax=Planctomicrobium sp. SH668 TaxID=3448126 RepID=UPI003F5C9B0E
MSLFSALLSDEAGMILSAEAAFLGTVGVVGATVGLSAIAHSINGELEDVAYSIRSLDQSFAFEGQRSAHAWTAGSNFTQEPVEVSRERLRQQIEEAKQAERERQSEDGDDAGDDETDRHDDRDHDDRQHIENEKQERRPERRKKRDRDQAVETSWTIDQTTESI